MCCCYISLQTDNLIVLHTVDSLYRPLSDCYHAAHFGTIITQVLLILIWAAQINNYMINC